MSQRWTHGSNSQADIAEEEYTLRYPGQRHSDAVFRRLEKRPSGTERHT
jgi:hypothetical protein